MYQTHLKRIRRMGSYIKNFLEPRLRGAEWEYRLFIFRDITHTLKTNPKDKFYTLGYWWVAIHLGILALIVGFTKLFVKYDEEFVISVDHQKWIAGFVYGIAFIYFIFRIVNMRKQSKNYEGGGGFEKEMDRIWKRVKQYNNGFCKDLRHFKKLLNVLCQKEIPQDIEKVYIKKKGECPHTENCRLNDIVKKLQDSLEDNDKENRLRRSKSYTFLIITFISLFSLNVISIWFANNYWTFFLAIGFILTIFGMLIFKKVKVKKIYFRNKRTKKMLAIDSNTTGPFPSNYVNPKIKSLLAWYFWYGWKKEWGKEKKQVDFTSDMWRQADKKEGAIDVFVIAFASGLFICLLVVTGSKLISLALNIVKLIK